MSPAMDKASASVLAMPFGLFEAKLIHKRLKALAVLSQVNGIRRRPEDRNTRLFQCIGKLKRRLPAKLHDHTM